VEGVLSANPANFTGTAPVLLVRDSFKSSAWYRDVLGFSFDRIWGEPPSFCMPRRDGFIIVLGQPKNADMIRTNDQVEGSSWGAYLWCKDAGKLFREFKSKGAGIAYKPVVRKLYGMKEFAIRDPDGHLLAFGQPWPPSKNLKNIKNKDN
jgi:catechol 2,3-dioxygenase-like lactoylglutathione lyase family enzyme